MISRWYNCPEQWDEVSLVALARSQAQRSKPSRRHSPTSLHSAAFDRLTAAINASTTASPTAPPHRLNHSAATHGLGVNLPINHPSPSTLDVLVNDLRMQDASGFVSRTSHGPNFTTLAIVTVGIPHDPHVHPNNLNAYRFTQHGLTTSNSQDTNRASDDLHYLREMLALTGYTEGQLESTDFTSPQIPSRSTVPNLLRLALNIEIQIQCAIFDMAYGCTGTHWKGQIGHLNRHGVLPHTPEYHDAQLRNRACRDLHRLLRTYDDHPLLPADRASDFSDDAWGIDPSYNITHTPFNARTGQRRPTAAAKDDGCAHLTNSPASAISTPESHNPVVSQHHTDSIPTPSNPPSSTTYLTSRECNSTMRGHESVEGHHSTSGSYATTAGFAKQELGVVTHDDTSADTAEESPAQDNTIHVHSYNGLAADGARALQNLPDGPGRHILIHPNFAGSPRAMQIMADMLRSRDVPDVSTPPGDEQNSSFTTPPTSPRIATALRTADVQSPWGSNAATLPMSSPPAPDGTTSRQPGYQFDHCTTNDTTADILTATACLTAASIPQVPDPPSVLPWEIGLIDDANIPELRFTASARLARQLAQQRQPAASTTTNVRRSSIITPHLAPPAALQTNSLHVRRPSRVTSPARVPCEPPHPMQMRFTAPARIPPAPSMSESPHPMHLRSLSNGRPQDTCDAAENHDTPKSDNKK